MNNKIPIVSVICTTFNHESYIRQALDGFVMQQCTFPVEVIVHDDASTDKTGEIIKEYVKKYPELIKPILQTENQYSKGFNVWADLFTKEAKGKYIALCEGDDYWTDSNKLQKQVDFLEANPEFSLCCHRYKTYDEESKKWNNDYCNHLFKENMDGLEYDCEFHFSKCWITKTMTVIFRREALNLSSWLKYKDTRDVQLFYFLLKIGKGYCMNYDAAVYRIHSGGIHSKISDIKKAMLGYNIYTELYYNNREDAFLKQKAMKGRNVLYNDIIQRIMKNQFSTILFVSILGFLNNEYRLEGYKECLIYLLRFVKIIIKGMFRTVYIL